MIRKPRVGKLTQGTVFCGGVAEDYPLEPVWGLVITARCDTAHEKVPLVNYLPIVSLDDWLLYDGALLLLDKIADDVRNSFKQLLSGNGLSESLLDVHAPREIAVRNFPRSGGDTSKKGQKQDRDSDKALQFAAALEALEALTRQGRISETNLAELVGKYGQIASKVISDLMSHRLAGHYFLLTIGPDTERACANGYVVLLREIHHLPRSATEKLVDGLTANDLAEVNHPALCCDSFDFLCPVAEIESPWIEHLMQVFTQLFSRIGIADLPVKEFVATLMVQLRTKGAS